MPLYTTYAVNAGQLAAEPGEEPRGRFGPGQRPGHEVDRVYCASKQVVLDPAVGVSKDGGS